MTPEEALARAAEAGVHRLQIPTPFAVGRVNCYLIEDRPLTLVDTGPNSGKSLDELQRQLDDAGHAIEDIELIVITHQHIDHLGLVEIIASHSGAEVAAIDVVVPFVERWALPGTVRALTAQLRPGGLLVAGFGTDRDHLPPGAPLVPLSAYDDACDAAGLEPVARHAGWGAEPYPADGSDPGYAVSVHRRPDRLS